MISPSERAAALTIALLWSSAPVIRAHSGPPFPIVTSRVAGPYSISIWTDPDTTDDGKAAGQFWVVLDPAAGSAAIPPGTQATVTIRPLDREGPSREGRAEPVNGSVARQFAALVMDHEGPFAVHVTVDGPLGRSSVDSRVDATYDTRPAPWLILVYLIPFVGLGVLWMKALRVRRVKRDSRPTAHHEDHEETKITKT